MEEKNLEIEKNEEVKPLSNEIPAEKVRGYTG